MKNQNFKKIYNKNSIKHNFLTPKHLNKIRWQKKNRILKEKVCAMLCESNHLKYFWTEAINIAYHVLNQTLIR